MLTAAIVFALTYLVLGIQQIPRVHLGRPSGALLGAVGMVAFGVVTFDQALAAIDLETILFLLGMMIVLAYVEISGFFEILERRFLRLARSPRQLLFVVVLSSGALSAAFMNDAVALMLTPVIVRACRRLELPAVPYLLALGLAANVGSACTFLGNPQNALVAVRSRLPMAEFTGALAPVSVLGLAVVAGILAWIHRARIDGRRLAPPPPAAPPVVARWLVAASLASGLGMVVALAAGVRPAAAAMAAAAAVVLAGAARPRVALAKVDWSLLLLFGGLFVVMDGVERSGLAAAMLGALSDPGFHAGASGLARLGGSVALLSQAVSNVPAVLLFVPGVEALDPSRAREAWLGLAAFSTLAGNLTILGSVANILVVECARREGVEIRFGEFLRAGVPVTIATLALAWGWLALVVAR